MDDEVDKVDVNINFIPCMTWVRRGVAKPEPERVKLTEEELAEVIKQTKVKLEDEGGVDEEEDDVEADNDNNQHEANGDKNAPGITTINGANSEKTDKQIADEYGLDDYDDEVDEQSASKLFGLGDLTVYSNPKEDPYLEGGFGEDEEEDLEDFKIRGTDNLLLTGHVIGDSATLEVYIYNDVEDALYVHHDILLPSLPLALEWLSFDPESEKKGNLVAVGSMQSEIQVWDLDLVDCLEPAFTLGRKGSKKKGIPRIGHKDAVLALSWNAGVEHVMASGSVDQTVILWDLNQKTEASKLKYHKEKVQGLSWHPLDPHTLATGCCDKFVRVADCRSTDSYKKWRTTGEVERVVWNHFNPYQVFASTDAGTIHAIDVRAEKPLWQLSAHTEGVTGLTLSSQCPGCLISSSSDKCLRVWDVSGDQPSFVMEQHLKLGVLQTVVGCPDAPFVVGLGGDNQENNFKVFDIRESAQVRQRFGSRKLENPLQTADFGHSTADEAEQKEMETDVAAEVLQSMSISATGEPTSTSSSSQPSSKPAIGGGAASKFKKDKKKKKKKTNF
eukprot:TRINITY_DN42682_c0_g1_i1.p1 TRINITY_DN42682_c0_g1~~TRINITY_DN42682_c0_g1_i1.p1  ORF type:complete len:558 (-),score=115.32 TRINITY_DN42682_c0_g1_i1:52-1725(-)